MKKNDLISAWMHHKGATSLSEAAEALEGFITTHRARIKEERRHVLSHRPMPKYRPGRISEWRNGKRNVPDWLARLLRQDLIKAGVKDSVSLTPKSMQ